MADIETEMANNLILRTDSLSASVAIEMPATPATTIFRYDLASRLKEAYRSIAATVKATTELIAQREMLLSDFLRDKTTAEATTANLGLQRRLEILTWVILGLTIAALIIGVLPESAKHAIWDILTSGRASRPIPSSLDPWEY